MQKRTILFKKAIQYESEYQTVNQGEITARRKAKITDHICISDQSKLAFVVRIRSINNLNPQVRRILRILNLQWCLCESKQASSNHLRNVEPNITLGYPSQYNIKKLILKLGYENTNKQKNSPFNNQAVEQSLRKNSIQSVEDLINKIYTVRPHFKQARNFFWLFQLKGPRGAKRHPVQRT